jgi:hypothetical protein
MGFLTWYEDERIEFHGEIYPLDMAYDTVLNVQRMFRERLLSDSDMLMEALKIFGIDEKSISRLTWDDRSELLNQIFEEKVKTRTRPRVGKARVLFDFEEDGEYIYASFMQDYGLDLIDQQGKLPWRRFMALFEGLSGDTKIKEVMKYRGMELPAPNGKNNKEIQDLMEIKAYYALGYHEDNGKDGLNKLFSTLEGMASRC